MEKMDPRAAQALIGEGALLVDIREADEHAREHIAGARCVPLSQLQAGTATLPASSCVVFHCASGMRTQANAALLERCRGGARAIVLDGGLQAWKNAGLATVADARAPLPLVRQVQLAAGTLALAGAVLGATVSPWFHLLSGFVGAGLMVAGATGFCGMARLLLKMPWNRQAA